MSVDRASWRVLHGQTVFAFDASVKVWWRTSQVFISWKRLPVTSDDHSDHEFSEKLIAITKRITRPFTPDRILQHEKLNGDSRIRRKEVFRMPPMRENLAEIAQTWNVLLQVLFFSGSMVSTGAFLDFVGVSRTMRAAIQKAGGRYAWSIFGKMCSPFLARSKSVEV